MLLLSQDNIKYSRVKAEYYIGTFNKGKDVEDLSAWYGKFAKWAEEKDGVYDSMTVAFAALFHSI